MEIELSSRNKPSILKATVLETFETPRILDGKYFKGECVSNVGIEEKEIELKPPQQKACKGDYPSPYDLSFDSSNFVVEGVEAKTSNMTSPSKHDTESKNEE